MLLAVVLVIDSRRTIGMPSCVDVVARFQRQLSFRIIAASWTVGTCVVNLNGNIFLHTHHCCLEKGMEWSVRLT